MSTPADLRYAANDARPSFWTGMPSQGRVEALLCEGCGRVLLYAVPKAARAKKERRA